MPDKPILFNSPMIRAVLDGRKTQTRCIFHPPAPDTATCDISVQVATGEYRSKYAPGDRLWVREMWGTDAPDLDTCRRGVESDGMSYGPYYAADADWFDNKTVRMRPSIHMPRWASRLTLTITDVRIERVQDISEADAMAEGLAKRAKDSVPTWKYGLPDRDGMPGTDDDGWQWQDWCVDPRNAFGKFWNSLNEARGYGWSANPWVVALTFTAERRNIDAEATNA